MQLAQKIKHANARWWPKKLFYSPDWLVLGVNNACNLHCKMCDVGLGNKETVFAQNLVGATPLNMPLELISSVLQQAATDFRGTRIGYAFTEPLAYPHLIPSLAQADALGLHTSVTTNALTLPRHAEALANAGLDELFISLDGPAEIHNEIRGNAKSYEKAIEGVEVLASQPRRPAISIYCVITQWNIGHLKRFLDGLRHLPIAEVGFMHPNFTSPDLAWRHNQQYGDRYRATESNLGELLPDEIDLDALWAEMRTIVDTQYPFRVSFSPTLQSRKALEVFYRNPSVFIGKRCNDAFRNVMIKSDGTVIPAHGRCFNLELGNLHEQPLRKIWNSAVAGQFRADLNRAGGLMPACSRCCSAF